MSTRRKSRNELTPFYEREARKRIKPEKMVLMDRRRRAYILRVGGLTNAEIGLALHADPTINPKKESVVGGYGWYNYQRGLPPVVGKSLANLVSNDMVVAYDQCESLTREALEMARQLELDRLDKAQASIWQRVQAGNDWAIDRFLGIVDRRMKLLGLDVVKVENVTNITVQGVLPDMDATYAQEVIAAIAELDSANTVLPEEEEILEGEVVD